MLVMLSVPEQRVEPDDTPPLSVCTSPDAEAGGLANHALGERLLHEGHLFDYVQALYLLERLLPADPALSTTATDTISAFVDRVHVRASPALAFPPADIRSIRLAHRSSGLNAAVERGRAPSLASAAHHADPVAVVTATFMGLYGIDSPLPGSLREDVSRDADCSSSLRAFLDIFDRRLYAFFYRAWRKHRPALRVPGAFASPDAAEKPVRPFLALTGCAAPSASEAPVAPLRLASFASTLARRTRSAYGLQTLLSGILDGLPVKVKENVSRWISVGAPSGLGHRGARLGVDTHLGRQIEDRSSTFRLVVGPVDIDTYRRLLPGEPLARRLAWGVDLYVSDILAYDVELVLRTEAVDELRLGGRAKLGQSTFLGDVAATVSRIVSYVDR